MATISTNDGVRLHYTDDGDGSPVVLIAGFGAPAESWEFQRRALLAEGHRVLALDRRSHGRSDRPAYGQRMSRHGKDVHDFLTALHLDDVVLVGGSMGGSTIWAYYDLFGDARLRGVVTVDQTPKMINDEGWRYGFYGLNRANAGTFFDKGIPDTGRGRPGDRLEGVARLVELLGAPPEFADPGTPPMRALLQDHAEKDWRDVVARVTVPALYLAGRDSQFWPYEHATAMAAGNERAEAVVIEDSGHAVNIDQPEKTNAAILEFIS
jgi:pimeloyl-ACP methyl ester carboxylesterase